MAIQNTKEFKPETMKSLSLALIIIFLFSCKDENSRVEIDPAILSMPNFNYQIVQSNTVSNTELIKNQKSILLMYFSPDCQHCQKETQLLKELFNTMPSTQFLFLSLADTFSIKSFIENYKLNNYANLLVGKDHEFSSIKFYKISNFPSLIIYNSKKRLVRIYTGEVSKNELIKDLKQS